ALAYGNEDRPYFAEGGHWPGVNGFDLPGFGFATPLPPGTPLKIEGDASQLGGELEVLAKNYQSTGRELSLDLSGGSATLPNDAGFYRLDLTGTWPQGPPEFFVVIQVAPASETAGYWVTFPDVPTVTDTGIQVIARTNLP